jgi:hypothetical protein
MDRRGRRRRLFTALGAGLGVLLVAGVGLLVAGLLGSSPVPLPGLPDNGQGMLQRGDGGGADGIGPAPTPAVPKTTSRTQTPGPAGSTPAVSVSTEKPGNRKTTHPGNPKPSRTR